MNTIEMDSDLSKELFCLWSSVGHSAKWDSAFLAIFSRIAKFSPLSFDWKSGFPFISDRINQIIGLFFVIY